jgi:hypothetical protein
MRRAALVLPLILAVASAAQAGPASKCDAEAESIVGRRAVRADKGLPAPRKAHNVPVDFSGMGKARVGSGMWMGEALIAADGTVAKVWPLRSPRFTPAWPEFDEVVAASVRQWRYEPTLVDGVATPLCMVVAMNFNW